ncbi:hypothetical protein M0804_001945 [Polistes exclamans]|nr:hypothetical protein M0804_001945 [Polistes exclamans]
MLFPSQGKREIRWVEIARCPNDVIYRTGQHSVFAREKAPGHDVSVIFVVRTLLDVLVSSRMVFTNAPSTIYEDLSSSSVKKTISGLSLNPSVGEQTFH